MNTMATINAIRINPPPMQGGRFKTISPKDADKLNLSSYTTDRKVRARHVDADVTETDYRCPGCSTEITNVTIGHGCHMSCGCGLEAQVFGNSISCWRDEHTPTQN